MNHNPVCVKCQVGMKPEKNGIGVLDITDFGPYKIWCADKWKCPKCGYEIAVGFGKNRIAEHYEDPFQRLVEYYRKQGDLVECRSE